MSFGKKNKFGKNTRDFNTKKDNDSVFSNTKRIHKISVEKINSNPYQPRLENGNIEELKDSIEKLGLLHPINVFRNEDGTFTLISGHRRLEAFKMLEKEMIDVVIQENDKNLQLKALAENIQRKELEPLELAFTYKDILDSNNLNYEDLSKDINKSVSHISQILNILKLSDNTISEIKKDKYKNILVLNKLNQVDKNKQLEIYNNIKELNREEAIKYINDFLKNNKEKIVKEPFNIKENKGKYSINIDITKLDDNEAKRTVSELYKIIKKIKEDNKLN